MAVVVKNPPANAGDIRDSGSIPGSERFPGGGHGNPLRYFCLENPMDRETWWPTVLGHTESDMTGRLSMHAHLCLEITLALFPQHLLPLLHFGVHLCTDIYIFWSVLFLEESNRMGKTRDLFEKIRYQGSISCKDGHNKGQKWYGPNRSRRY